ncbi:roadblock/LC7 domain-containing protein [Caldivirga sp. UBA161]|uniref:roadblock/LC7 domain-containing protein n=1 Tax=Caldivirga sp. UBA161 TaxID=1915569 RepID=UPI0025BFA117|nr:roadblock/LC7 domain-containing protein [Caldivirga sp. UBA161]
MSVIGQNAEDLSVVITYIRGRLKGLLGIYVASLDGLLISYNGAGDPDRWAALTATLAALSTTYIKEMANLTMSNHKHMYTIIRSDKGFILNVKRNDYALTIVDNDPSEEDKAIKVLDDALTKIT